MFWCCWSIQLPRCRLVQDHKENSHSRRVSGYTHYVCPCRWCWCYFASCRCRLEGWYYCLCLSIRYTWMSLFKTKIHDGFSCVRNRKTNSNERKLICFSGDLIRLPKGASVPVTLKVLEYDLFHISPLKVCTSFTPFFIFFFLYQLVLCIHYNVLLCLGHRIEHLICTNWSTWHVQHRWCCRAS